MRRQSQTNQRRIDESACAHGKSADEHALGMVFQHQIPNLHNYSTLELKVITRKYTVPSET
jgi:hypothetical protein